MQRIRWFLLFVFIFSALFGVVPSQAQTDKPWMDTSLAPEERAKLLLAEMTLEEKIAMVSGDTAGNDRGYVGHISANERLGIPELNMKDGPSGVGNGANDVTAFPAPITVAASWDVSLMEQYAAFMAEEQRGKGVNVHLAPMMNLTRVPRAGRNFEGYGEDPYLSALMAAAEVRGIQSMGLIAVAKHYINNEQEFQRTEGSSEIDLRTQHEIYLPPFVASIEAGVGAFMCSYNKVNGVYACENPEMQNELLKDELGFDGWIMSDWNATHSTVGSALGGLDMEMPGGAYFSRTLLGAINSNQVPVSRLNDMVLRILTSMFKAGLFDREPVGDPNAIVRTDEHAQLTREAAAQGMVLLKNDANLLPLDANTIKSIAVFGVTADAAPLIAGGGSSHVNPPYIVTPLQGIIERAGANVDVRYYDLSQEAGRIIPSDFFQTPQATPGLQAEYFNSTSASDSPVAVSITPNLDLTWSNSAPAPGVDASNWSARFTGILAPKTNGMYNLALTSTGGSRLYLDDKLIINNQGGSTEQTVIFRKRLVSNKTYNIRVEFSQSGNAGSLRLSWYTPEDDFLLQAADHASQADVAIVIAGAQSDEGSDRQSLVLPDEKLINTIAAANPHTVVVVYTPAQVLMDWHTQVPAILLGWLPGQEAGHALADVLFGDVNPSGRLPITIANAEADYPANTVEMYPGRDRRVLYSEGLQIGYRHFDAQNIEPLYPFGYGLSYTTFEYGNLTITPTASDSSTTITVTVDVKNTGQRAGAEVAQLYLGMPTETSEPPKQLKGFQKLTLQPGETKTATFTLTPADYSFWSAGMNEWAAYPGEYQVMVGSSSRDIHQSATFTVDNVFFDGKVIQARAAELSGGATLASDGTINGLIKVGTAAQFKVDVKEAGEYNVIVRYASTLRPGAQNTPRTLSLYINGVKQKQIQFPNLANWEMWDVVAHTMKLDPGENIITYQFDEGDNGDVYLDALRVAPVNPPSPTVTAVMEPLAKRNEISRALIFSLLVAVFALFAVFMARKKRW